MKKRAYNYSAGPAVLPVEVLDIVTENLYSYADCGVGTMEISHRSAEFEKIIGDAETNLRELLGIGSDFSVIFIGGGGTLQFSMVPLNLRAEGQTADYLVTGFWAEKAAEEAKRLGSVHIAADSSDRNHCYIPSKINLSKNPAYVHYTCNNTIYGTQFKTEPDVGKVPLVCDASSDLLSRRINLSKYGLIYAGAQKNLGPAGVTVVIVRNDLLERSPSNLPVYLDYNTHAKNKSLYNTAPTFPIFVMGEVFKWVKKLGGVSAMEKLNEAKAKILYDVLDSNPFYISIAEKEFRSLMNVTFKLRNQPLEADFIKQADKAGFSGLKGHRNLGGVRASIYNAFPVEGVQAFAQFMDEFSQKNG